MKKENESRSNIELRDFQLLTKKEVTEIVQELGKPQNVALMIDGTRRLLKVEPEHNDDAWLYDSDHITALMHKSIQAADDLFDMGIEVVTGPLASYGNLQRDDFMPTGLERLLDPLLDDFSLQALEKHNATVHFYGDLSFIDTHPSGKQIEKYLQFFNQLNQTRDNPTKHILVGLGFTTDRDTIQIAHQAISLYEKTGQYPTQQDLIEAYFGVNIPPIDIFIRTNEFKASGGLTPLLVNHDTQFYFPSSPGLISINENNLKAILYDYLFNRNLSGGHYAHAPITSAEAVIIKDFYTNSQNHIAGVGKRIADIWINN
ncbi:hypothetical protein COT86_00705 [Candidatus Collierbacteria bacterium CG10_big_fil_rev_8_21_14_0_10_43_36]|uniref:Uncharacterized protein n=3 Tax=Candidatus Collieribacteriota TaxID=1752725 RepID=A0A2H0DT47_9BACT|nr:hypothetical protein [Candidatus Parcubacteria bacterium]PIP85356.1 MAG: hypothetical protein COW83_04755 [Candidatus Collierbacteria bacterium CG22_combo_CG10-13_8_21_14_all_43_12]PIS00053.1 MAG: hypothetical protein COT86_00705 [Candidatus Collierbacteria bacterium CG10_big_fil_rev_8_21_14_0_10_43_36]PIZ24277.1 MAG: hypothetical protein COY48_03850 [Candidatus Collierbacteria bacterium CG_4_10_14_0_8_um_filter_43_86]